MNEVNFKIFIPQKKERITPNKIVLILSIPSLFMLICNEDYSQLSFLCGLGQVSLFLALGLGLYFTVTKHTRVKPLDGTLEKRLTFNLESILIAGEKYFISSIKKVDFSIQDYYDKWDYTRDFNPARSNGVDNKLILTLKNGEIIETKFQLMYQGEMKKLEEQLIEYHRSGILHFLKLIDLLGINDYDEIQEFKKRLTIK